MQRRDFLRTSAGLGGLVGLSGLAGCTSLFQTRSARSPPLVENRPDAVYVPTHVEGMEMVGMAEAKPYMLALSYSFPHRFWTITGTTTNRVSIQGDDSVHLMLSLWDMATKTVVPNDSLSMEITQDGETVDERTPWPMLSQNMGFHFGDNVSLSGDGTYTVNVEVSSLGTRGTGEFEGRFDESVSASFDFEYSESQRNEISYTTLENRQGEKSAVDPMEMEMMPLSQLPEPNALPGTLLGTGSSGDAQFVALRLEDGERFGADGHYLAISPRTPYNRYPLPLMSLSATVERGDETVFDGSLTETLDPELGLHYGAAVDSLESGDAVTLTVDSPPQVSRHEGYETAFIQMAEMTFSV